MFISTVFIGFLLITACTYDVINKDGNVVNNEIKPCASDTLFGVFRYSSDEKKSPQTLHIYETDGKRFETHGLDGLWYPACSFSGEVVGCEIILDSYENVKIQGLPSPGGFPRYYYDTFSGHGEFFPEQDSFVVHIDFVRTGFPAEFHGNLYFKKKN